MKLEGPSDDLDDLTMLFMFSLAKDLHGLNVCSLCAANTVDDVYLFPPKYYHTGYCLLVAFRLFIFSSVGLVLLGLYPGPFQTFSMMIMWSSCWHVLLASYPICYPNES